MLDTRKVILPTLFASMVGALLMYALIAGRLPGTLQVQAGPASVAASVPELQSAVVRAADRVMPSVVNIDTTVTRSQARMPNFPRFSGMPQFRFPMPPMQAKGQGSGVIVSTDGLILTNDHVVHGATDIQVTLSDQRKFKGVVKGTDPITDVALVKIEAHGLPAAELGDSDRPPIGTFVIAVGNPYGFDHTMTMGVLSGRHREIPEPGKDMRNLLQTDAAINPGNSGGPLADLDGRVIGINTAILSQAQGMGFAIPINTAKDIMRQLQANGRVIRPFVGLATESVTDDVARYLKMPRTEGLLVERVVPNSPAEQAGLTRGDVILEVDGMKPKDAREFQDRVRGHRIGDEIALKVWSNARTSTVRVKLREMPDT